MTALILGGPALYLVGNALFTWALSGLIPWSRLVAVAALLALMPLATGASALTLHDRGDADPRGPRRLGSAQSLTASPSGRGRTGRFPYVPA